MTAPSSFHVLVVANAFVVGLGLIITALSYATYRTNGRDPVFLASTLGFLLITVGGILAPVYEFGITGDYVISADELLRLQILEGSVIAVGLALLLASVVANSSRSKRFSDNVESDTYP